MTPHANKYELRRRNRASEAQNHRCAICGLGIEPRAYANDTNRACLIAVDPDKPKTFSNAIAVCPPCAGECGNFPAWTVWQRFQSGDYVPFHNTKKARRKPKQVEYPDTLKLIKEAFEQVGRGEDAIPVFYRFAPPERAEHIAKKLLARPAPRKSRRCRGRVRRYGHDQSLSEAQNHRCCYCRERMSDDRQSWRFATIEHVIEVSKGGKSIFENLTMACMVCNSMRSQLGMTAYEYAEFAQQNPDHILQELKRLGKKRFRDNLRRASESYPK
jgi:5-methylcytosine-specific restriction endonuclease McrA